MRRIVFGLGFRAAAEERAFAAALREGLARFPQARAAATPAAKAGHDGLARACAGMGLALVAVDAAAMRAADAGVVTRSRRIEAGHGVGSVAEAAALAAAGPRARLLAPRRIAADGLVTIAVAESGA